MAISVLTRRRVIFFAALVTYFFTCMNKVLVPGSLYTEIRSGLALNATQLALLGSGFMISYALSNFLLGIFSDRYGGGRLLVAGSFIFTVGAVTSVLAGSFTTFFCARLLVGFGAGVCYIGLSKLTAELFERNFLWMLTLVLMTGCAGVFVGGAPMLIVAQHTSWRWAIALPAGVGVVTTVLIIIFARGALFPVGNGNQWSALKEFFRSANNLKLMFSLGTIYGSYFALMALIGKKCLDDDGSFSPAAIGVIFSVFIAVNILFNPLGNILLKWSGDRRIRFVITLLLTTTVGSALGALRFGLGAPAAFLVVGMMLIAAPSGCNAVFFSAIKDFNSPQVTGLAISMLNFLLFVFIAVEQQIVGFILHCYEKSAVNGVYPPEAYMVIFLVLGAITLLGTLVATRLPEPKSPDFSA